MELRGVCLASFCFRLPGQDLYDACCEELNFVLIRFSTVLLHVSFDSESITFAAYQSFLTHVYVTLAERHSECEVVVVDPSLPLARVVAEEPWCSIITTVTPSIG
jgi:hypothetical protein